MEEIIVFKFPAHRHFEFDDVSALSLLLLVKLDFLLCETIGQRNDVIKSKMAARGKLKKDSIFRF